MANGCTKSICQKPPTLSIGDKVHTLATAARGAVAAPDANRADASAAAATVAVSIPVAANTTGAAAALERSSVEWKSANY